MNTETDTETEILTTWCPNAPPTVKVTARPGPRADSRRPFVTRVTLPWTEARIPLGAQVVA